MYISLSLITTVCVIWFGGWMLLTLANAGVPFGFFLILGWIGAAAAVPYSPGVAVVAGAVLAVVTLIWLLARIGRSAAGTGGVLTVIIVLTLGTMALLGGQ